MKSFIVTILLVFALAFSAYGADTKGSELPTATPATGDRVIAVDDPAGTPSSKTFDIDDLGTYFQGVFYTESEVDSLLSGKESATSNDIDPDRLNGDSSDDNMIDEGIISADITRDSEAAAAYEAIDSNDLDPDRLAGDSTDDNLVDEGIIDADITRDSEAAAAYQSLDDDLTDLADGTLSKSKVEDSTNWDAAYAWGDHSGLYESATSNDIDPDRIAGDTTDDNLLDEAAIDADITRDSEAAAAYESTASNDFDPDRILGDSVDDNLIANALLDVLAGNTFSNFGDVDDDTLNELLQAIDDSWPSASGAPADATYLTATEEAGLSSETNLGALSTGILKLTVNTGVAAPSIAAEGDFPSELTRDSEAAAAYEAIDSNDFDPDRIAGDTSDDDLLDEAVIDADIARDSEIALAVNEIDNPTAAATWAFDAYTWDVTFGAPASDAVEIQASGNFGDIAILRLYQHTGNPTNGTMFESYIMDSDVDHFRLYYDGSLVGYIDYDGSYHVAANSTSGQSLTLYEDTDNPGSNYISHKAADSIGNNLTFTWGGASINVPTAAGAAPTFDTTPSQDGWMYPTDFIASDLDESPDSDDSGEGVIMTMTVDSGVTYSAVGQAVHVDTDGELVEADADASATMPCIGLLLESGTGSKKVLTHGIIRNDDWDWTVGGIVYVSTDPSTTTGLTQTAPSGAGDFVQVVGVATHADRILLNIDLTLIEVSS